MKLGNRLAMLGVALLLLLFLVYMGFQIAQNLSEQTITVDAVEVTIEDKLSVEGAFLRDQLNVYGGNGNNAEYLVEDGEKVAAGQPLAIYFDGEAALQEYRDCQNLRDQLSALEYARDSITGGADSLKMDELISRQMVTLNNRLADGQPKKTESEYARLRQLIISRSATKDDQEQFDAAITQLRSEIKSGELAFGGGSKTIAAPVSGYFTNFCDGYEAILTAEARETLSPDDILLAKAKTDSEAIGTLTKGFSWYFAAVTTAEEVNSIRGRESITVYFPELCVSPLRVEVASIRICDDGRAVVLLRSGVMDAQYLEARRQTVDLVIERYTGIKVPKDALRQQDGVWGVYVLDGSVAKFKPVTWIYHTDSYFVVPCADSADLGLYRYDKIIVRAKDLADNKVLD